MSVPGQMTAKTLNALKGWSANMNALDFHAKISANVTFNTASVPVPAGRVGHLNSAGEIEMGVTGFQMPLHIMTSSQDPDVTINGGDPTADKGAFVSAIPAGHVLVLVGSGPFELAATDYDTGASYVRNSPLKAVASNSLAATGGQLTLATFGTDTIVGCVSRGVADNGYGFNALCFWTVFLPHGL